MEKAYVIHWKQLPERKQKIVHDFPELSLEFVEKYDRKEVTRETIFDVYPEMKEWFSQNIIDKIDCLSGICHTMSLIKILEDITEPSLILEDDSFSLVPKFKMDLDDLMKNPPPNWDILFISNAKCGSEIGPKIRGAYGNEWLRVNECRFTNGFIVSPKGARKLLDIFKRFGALQPIPGSRSDNWISKIMVTTDSIDGWWTVCPIIGNGNHYDICAKSYVQV